MRSISATILRLSGALLASTAAPGGYSALAQEPAEAHVTTNAAWVVAAETDAGERLVEGPRPAGATEMLITGRFRYEGTEPASGLRIVLAVPEGTVYVADSALGPGAEASFSVDGGRTFGAAADLRVPVEPDDPASTTRAAGPVDYSHIRWTLPGTHPPGLAGLVSFRASPTGEAADAATGTRPIEEAP